MREQVKNRVKTISLMELLPSRRYPMWRSLPLWLRVTFWTTLVLAFLAIKIAFGLSPDPLKACFFVCVITFCAVCGTICRLWGSTIGQWFWYALCAAGALRLFLLLWQMG